MILSLSTIESICSKSSLSTITCRLTKPNRITYLQNTLVGKTNDLIQGYFFNSAFYNQTFAALESRFCSPQHVVTALTHRLEKWTLMTQQNPHTCFLFHFLKTIRSNLHQHTLNSRPAAIHRPHHRQRETPWEPSYQMDETPCEAWNPFAQSTGDPKMVGITNKGSWSSWTQSPTNLQAQLWSHNDIAIVLQQQEKGVRKTFLKLATSKSREPTSRLQQFNATVPLIWRH